jgi:hypothetical protein
MSSINRNTCKRENEETALPTNFIKSILNWHLLPSLLAHNGLGENNIEMRYIAAVIYGNRLVSDINLCKVTI